MKRTRDLVLALCLPVLAACEMSKESPNAGARGTGGRSAEDLAERAAERAEQAALREEQRRVAGREAFDRIVAEHRKVEPLYDSGTGTITWADRRDGDVFTGDLVVIARDEAPERLLIAKSGNARLEQDRIILREWPNRLDLDKYNTEFTRAPATAP